MFPLSSYTIFFSEISAGTILALNLYFLMLVLRSEFSNGDVDTAMYVGCFNTKHAEASNRGQKIESFTWRKCMKLCEARYTRYAGLQVSKGYCYCSNYLVENADKVSPTLCTSKCHDGITRMCGGPKTQTIYRLREKSLPRVMLFTSNGIYYIENKNLVPMIMTNINFEYPSGISYHYRRNEIYFFANSRIYRTSYDVSQEQYQPVKVIIEDSEISTLTIDWVGDLIYYGTGDRMNEYSSGARYKIGSSSLDGSHKAEVLRDITGVLALAIDPYKKLLFYALRDRNEAYYMDLTSKRYNAMPAGSKSTVMFIDTYSIKLYEDINKDTIQVLDYANIITGRKILDFYDYIKQISSVSITEEILVVSVEEKEQCYFVIFMITDLDPFGYKTIRKSDGNLYRAPCEGRYRPGVVAYHELVQIPPPKPGCNSPHCVDDCTYTAQHYYGRCVCPNYMYMGNNGKTCLDAAVFKNDTTDLIDGTEQVTKRPVVKKKDEDKKDKGDEDKEDDGGDAKEDVEVEYEDVEADVEGKM